MNYQLRPPELLDLTLRNFYELTTFGAEKVVQQLRVAIYTDWKSQGLRSLSGKRVYLHKDMFLPENCMIANQVFTRLGDVAALDSAYGYITNATRKPYWYGNIVDMSVQTQIFVTPLLAPSTTYKWMLLVAEPFDDELQLLSCDMTEEVIKRGIPNQRTPRPPSRHLFYNSWYTGPWATNSCGTR